MAAGVDVAPYIDFIDAESITAAAPPPDPEPPKDVAEPSPCAQQLSDAWQWTKAVLTFLKPFIVASIYSMIGAGLFIAYEHDVDLAAKQAARNAHTVARKRLHLDVYKVIFQVHPQYADRHIHQAIRRYDSALELDDGLAPLESDWTFWNALLFAATIYTTIGYGNMACVTRGGRLATIFYAIVGLPLMFSVLNDLGTSLLKIVKSSVIIVERRWNHTRWYVTTHVRRLYRRYRATRSDHLQAMLLDDSVPLTAIVSLPPEKAAELDQMVDKQNREEAEQPVDDGQPPLLVSFIVTISWLFLCAGIFLLWESWSYFDSFYFFFISLTTIGLGDITPSYPQYAMLTFPLVLIGLALVSVSFNVLSEQLELIYLNLLRSLLDDYTSSVAGEEQRTTRTGMGIMGKIKKTAVTKVLMPMMSKDTRESVMQKFQEEAKAQGIQLPAALTMLDDSGLPSIMNVDQENLQTWIHEQEEQMEKNISETSVDCQTDEPLRTSTESQTVISGEYNPDEDRAPPKVDQDTRGTQTDRMTGVDKSINVRMDPGTSTPAQTDMSCFGGQNRANQTDLLLTGEKKEMVDEGIQTGILARVQHMMAKPPLKTTTDEVLQERLKGEKQDVKRKGSETEVKRSVGQLKSQFDQAGKSSPTDVPGSSGLMRTRKNAIAEEPP